MINLTTHIFHSGAYGGFSGGFNQFGADGQGFGSGYSQRLGGYPQNGYQNQGGYQHQGGYQQQQGYY